MSTCRSCAYLDENGHCEAIGGYILQETGVRIDTPFIHRSWLDDEHDCPCFERVWTADEALIDGMDWVVNGPLVDPYCAGKKPGDTVDEPKWRK